MADYCPLDYVQTGGGGGVEYVTIKYTLTDVDIIRFLTSIKTRTRPVFGETCCACSLPDSCGFIQRIDWRDRIDLEWLFLLYECI